MRVSKNLRKWPCMISTSRCVLGLYVIRGNSQSDNITNWTTRPQGKQKLANNNFTRSENFLYAYISCIVFNSQDKHGTGKLIYKSWISRVKTVSLAELWLPNWKPQQNYVSAQNMYSNIEPLEMMMLWRHSRDYYMTSFGELTSTGGHGHVAAARCRCLRTFIILQYANMLRAYFTTSLCEISDAWTLWVPT